ncbi:MAG: hypothetical protein R2791_04500 [Saprospiraceae bacterium]
MTLILCLLSQLQESYLALVISDYLDFQIRNLKGEGLWEDRLSLDMKDDIYSARVESRISKTE